MKLLRGPQNFAEFSKGVVATIGNFDGVHRGHQDLLHALKVKANLLGLPLMVILFEPQPREYLQKESAPSRLSSFREKWHHLSRCQVDYLYCIRFNTRLASISAIDFIRIYLQQFAKIKYLLVGEDFRFGYQRAGDVTLLREQGVRYGCEIGVHIDFCVGNERVSSTIVRQLLSQGDLQRAAGLIGKTYSLWGRVMPGDGRGRQWGIPTANFNVHRRALAVQGVFVVRTCIDSTWFYGVANVGRRPTVDGSKQILEVHLLDFNQAIYGLVLEVFFLHKLRDEVKFTSVDQLIRQIHQDIAQAKAYLCNDYLE